MASRADGFTHLSRGDAFYRPMVALVKYLEVNAFTMYVVSGSDRTVVRELVNANLDIPENRVIGMSHTVVTRNQDGVDGLEYIYTKEDKVVLDGELVIKAIKMNKVCAIAQEIGKVPVLSFGNAASDQSMAQYTVNNDRHETRAYMLLCANCGFEPISKCDDSATIRGGDVGVVPYEQIEVEPATEVVLKPAT